MSARRHLKKPLKYFGARSNDGDEFYSNSAAVPIIGFVTVEFYSNGAAFQ